MAKGTYSSQFRITFQGLDKILVSGRKAKSRIEIIAGDSAEIRDPIHGYIFATKLEREIIDTETFQRLRRIRQLAGCFLVYPGGQHSRFEHVIGSMYLAGRVGSVLEARGPISFRPEDSLQLRLAALLHDVGHGPFSHMFEEVMAEKTKVTHEDMTQKIIMESEIGVILEKNGVVRKEIAELAVGKSTHQPRFMNDVIGGRLSVDTMDYLLRDSYFTGVEYGKVDVTRLINSFEVARNKLAIRQAALFVFEALMIARYQMFRAVYFHRTVRAGELMLIKSMLLADKELNLTSLSLESYLSLTDEITLHRILTMNSAGDSELGRARKLASDYWARKLLKCVFERTVQRKDKFLASIFSQKSFRDRLADEIAKDAGVEVQDIYVDVPTAPSVPVSSTREALEGITLVKRNDGTSEKHGKQGESYEINLEDMPLIGTIAGFMDIMRVYTIKERREQVKKAVGRVLGREGFESNVWA